MNHPSNVKSNNLSINDVTALIGGVNDFVTIVHNPWHWKAWQWGDGVTKHQNICVKTTSLLLNQTIGFFFQVKSHTRAISLNANGDLLDRTNWLGTIGSTPEQSHSSAGSANDALPGNNREGQSGLLVPKYLKGQNSEKAKNDEPTHQF